jgi:hypothetical protein
MGKVQSDKVRGDFVQPAETKPDKLDDGANAFGAEAALNETAPDGRIGHYDVSRKGLVSWDPL